MPKLLSIRDFSDRYAVCRTRVYALLSGGALLAVKFGSKTLIDADSAERWAKALPRFRSTAAPARPTDSAR